MKLRPYQQQAVDQLERAWLLGRQVACLEGPTGTGKTHTAEGLRRAYGAKKSVYCCSTRRHQADVVEHFPRAAVLEGKAHYDSPAAHKRAVSEAKGNSLAVLSTPLWLAQVRSGAFRNRPVVLDEADQLLEEGCRSLTLELSISAVYAMDEEPPIPGVSVRLCVAWVRCWVDKAEKKVRDRWRTDAWLREQLQAFLSTWRRYGERVEEGAWVNSSDSRTFRLAPVWFAPYAQEALWDHASRALLMSATFVGLETQARLLGREEFEAARLPAVIPAENRPVYYAPVCRMNRDSDWGAMAEAVERIIQAHPKARILVHTVSWTHQQSLYQRLNDTRRVYGNVDRDACLRFSADQEGSVVLSPALERGYDMDWLDVIIWPKLPHSYLGDPVVLARLRDEIGRKWYALETLKRVIQGCGRGTRHPESRCKSYILDAGFGRLYQENRDHLPRWFTDAVWGA